jgi:HEAT repeat protein
VRAELARASLDAMDSSLPERPPPDRQQRIEAAVRELSRAGPEDDAPLRRRVLAFGEEALPALAQAFPGTTWVDLSRPHRPLRSARQLSAVCSAMVSFGDAAVPPVARLLRAPHPAVRLAAALTAADLIHGDLVRPLAARLHDEVPAVRDAAMFALRASALLDEARVLRAELVSTLQDDEVPADWRRRAAWTLGQLRDAEAVPQLVEQLGAGAGVAEAARQALVRLTGRDLGRFRFRWRGWWTRHREEDRAAWLVAALDQGDARLRALAAEELVLLTGAGFDRRRAVATRRGARELAAFYGGLLR